MPSSCVCLSKDFVTDQPLAAQAGLSCIPCCILPCCELLFLNKTRVWAEGISCRISFFLHLNPPSPNCCSISLGNADDSDKTALHSQKSADRSHEVPPSTAPWAHRCHSLHHSMSDCHGKHELHVGRCDTDTASTPCLTAVKLNARSATFHQEMNDQLFDIPIFAFNYL